MTDYLCDPPCSYADALGEQLEVVKRQAERIEELEVEKERISNVQKYWHKTASCLRTEVKKERKRIEELEALLKEAHAELAQHAHDEHPYRDEYPDQMRRYKRDMDFPNRIAVAIRGETMVQAAIPVITTKEAQEQNTVYIEELEAEVERLTMEVDTWKAVVEVSDTKKDRAVAAERERICQYIKSREMWARLRDKNIGEIPHTIAYAIEGEYG